jgi:pyruvate dehydrogenase E2 component (dihydrolipoamide acetyltransferase)
MAIELRLPDLGEGVASAKLISWLKREGDRISAGEPIAEVETDKTSMELEAPISGVLEKIHVGASGDDVSIDTVLAIISDGAMSETDDTGQPGHVDPAEGAGEADAIADEGRAELEAGDGLARDSGPAPDAGASEVRATPLARRMAIIAGIALMDIPGSGPEGQVGKSDVEAILRRRRGMQSPLAAPAAIPPAAVSTLEAPTLSAVRRVTAERMAYAKQTIPHFYLRVDCHVDRMLEMRRELNAGQSEARLSLTVFVVAAAAQALRSVPQVNSTWSDGAVRLYESADIAVAVDTPAGIITPIIRGAENKSLVALALELEDLSRRARAGRLQPAEYNGGTFTISNLGMYGVTSLYPIVNPPQSGILGVGAIERRPVVRGDKVVAGSMMTCTLSADHRSLDGATAARFLDEFRRRIEDVERQAP